MRKILAALLLVVFTVMTLPTSPALADGVCVIEISESIGIVICDDETIGTVPIPEIRVEVPGPPVPGPTVTIPGETVTLPPIIKPPKPPVTVTVPGPTETVTVTIPPDPSETVTVPGPTVFAQPPPREPAATKTVTIRPAPKKVTPSPVPIGPQIPQATEARQDPAKDAILAPKRDKKLTFGPFILSGPAAVGLGLVAISALAGLILLGMYGGYIIGYKDSERADTNFMRALRDSMMYRGKHS